MKEQTEKAVSMPKPFGVEFFEEFPIAPVYGGNSMNLFANTGTHGCSTLKSGQDDIGPETCDTF